MTKKQGKKLILIELNEINFEIVSRYLNKNPDRYTGLKKLFDLKLVITSAEVEYEKLEPWIQWVSVHTGLSYKEHGVFRLGDIVNTGVEQLFEKLEKNGLKVGSISAMNARNDLHDPMYFIPDPWTQTKSDNRFLSSKLSNAISQIVNDNSKSKISIQSAIVLVGCLIAYGKFKNYLKYLQLLIGSKSTVWKKAMFLDLFLHDYHMNRIAAHRPDFSAVFFNAGAHIQHHYLFNSTVLDRACDIRNPSWYVANNQDPLKDLLELYDYILDDYLSQSDYEIVVATGLSQKPYDRLKFYYRLKDHSGFLLKLNLRFKSVVPRMTRDFLVEFDDASSRDTALDVLSKLRFKLEETLIFGDIEVRPLSLFVTLTYPSEIKAGMELENDCIRLSMYNEVAFVAIKNGMHDSKGYAFFSKGIVEFAPTDGSHVKELNASINKFFNSSMRAFNGGQ
jgi:hypothetical protein